MKQYEMLPNTTPTLDEYVTLCSSVGWKEYMNFDVAEASLAHSVYSVMVKDRNEVIGMGRIVGDGAIYFYIQDVVVRPSFSFLQILLIAPVRDEHMTRGMGHHEGDLCMQGHCLRCHAASPEHRCFSILDADKITIIGPGDIPDADFSRVTDMDRSPCILGNNEVISAAFCTW